MSEFFKKCHFSDKIKNMKFQLYEKIFIYKSQTHIQNITPQQKQTQSLCQCYKKNYTRELRSSCEKITLHLFDLKTQTKFKLVFKPRFHVSRLKHQERVLSR